MIEVWIDGMCEPVLPEYARKASIGFIIKRNGKTIHKHYEIIGKGEDVTNNIAEYTALARALESIKSLKLDEEKIVIKSDSKLVVKQMREKWKVKANHLKPLFCKAQILASPMDIDFQWIPRGENTEADNLARLAIARETCFQF